MCFIGQRDFGVRWTRRDPFSVRLQGGLFSLWMLLTLICLILKVRLIVVTFNVVITDLNEQWVHSRPPINMYSLSCSSLTPCAQFPWQPWVIEMEETVYERYDNMYPKSQTRCKIQKPYCIVLRADAVTGNCLVLNTSSADCWFFHLQNRNGNKHTYILGLLWKLKEYMQGT